MKKRYFKIFKPYGMLSQFSRDGDRSTLADLNGFPPDVYPIGRLDADSEGLLLLTNNAAVNALLLDPKNEHERTYWVQVEGDITPEAIEALQKPLKIKVKNTTHTTLPCRARKIPEPKLPPRVPPVRFRKEIPTSWVELTLVEGKNRQVRKMTAKVGFPTLRLVRVCIKDLKGSGLMPGQVKELNEEDFFRCLGLPMP
jgi:23S rRNA pseudouridine2457 synthase